MGEGRRQSYDPMVQKPVGMKKAQWEIVDDYMDINQLASRSEAVRELVRTALIHISERECKHG